MTAEVMRLKRRASLPIQSARADWLLQFIGLPQSDIPNARAISKMSMTEKEWLLFDARKVYLDRIKQAHPDKGGDDKEASDLNLAMDRLSHLLTNAPGIFIPASRRRARRGEKPRLLVDSNCARCGSAIKKWHPHHLFCSDKCKYENRYYTITKPSRAKASQS